MNHMVKDQVLTKHENQINKVLEIAFLLQNDSSDVKQRVHEIYESMDRDDVPVPSIASITSLALQLSRVCLSDTKARIESINRGKEQVQKVVNQLSQVQISKEKEIDLLRLKLLQKESHLIKCYEEQISKVIKQIEEFEMTRIKQVEMQALKIQNHNFQILLDMSFQKSEKKRTLLFHYQPILKIEEFLGYNLTVINQFVERLIDLQRQLSFLFKIQLPHLDTLCKCLPSKRFYDLLKKKEMLITGQKDSIIDEERYQSEYSTTPKEIDYATEKIVRLGDAYQLPLSSKTLNYQRRVARSSSVEPGELNQIPTIVRENSSTPSALSQPGSATSKKITIPHRIINKPFNKLSIKDFLEFLVIIVKVSANFEVFLGHFSMQGREFSIDESADFEKILNEIAHLDTQYPLGSVVEKRHPYQNFQKRLEHVYNQIINSLFAKKQHNKPVALQNLNFKNLFLNQPKSDQRDDWDIISEML
ncbi:hypothetical protein KGF56_001862 [Candida oxycetoniae]|uniref:Uncharacterized protein n=1 Tax=Candida oxycetoniae TaxID=497107 RepID=A0AAI9WYF7_9ASCO|nr:uncharacterized protein KGF56_001862 [Candida oxycetoniae]KAI3405321.2 hypothetical protein KGF56_001862 [Candida oxycetoniae]